MSRRRHPLLGMLLIQCYSRRSLQNDDKYINMVQRGSINGHAEVQRFPVQPKQWKVLYAAIMWTTIGILVSVSSATSLSSPPPPC